MLDIGAIQAFLEKLDYTIKQSTNRYTTGVITYFDVYYSNGVEVVTYGESLKEACEFALNHFLTGELGRKWRKIWAGVLENNHTAFSTQEYEDIRQAAQWYEELAAA